MKTKDQILWEEKRQLEILIQNRPLLSLKTNLVINNVCVNYLISCHETKRNFAIIKTENEYDKTTLEYSGYRTLQAEEIHAPTIEFLIDYIFRR